MWAQPCVSASSCRRRCRGFLRFSSWPGLTGWMPDPSHSLEAARLGSEPLVSWMSKVIRGLNLGQAISP